MNRECFIQSLNEDLELLKKIEDLLYQKYHELFNILLSHSDNFTARDEVYKERNNSLYSLEVYFDTNKNYKQSILYINENENKIKLLEFLEEDDNIEYIYSEDFKRYIGNINEIKNVIVLLFNEFQ